MGALAAWTGFTLPSALLMVGFAIGVARIADPNRERWVHGLLVAAVAVVGAAVVGMFRTLCPDWPRRTAAAAVAAFIVFLPANPYAQVVAIAAGALAGAVFLRGRSGAVARALPARGSKPAAIACGVAFLALLAGLPVAAHLGRGGVLAVIAAFYASGALVFGGGHVVLPLLQARVVPPGWIDAHAFLAGYGAAQAVPGPLFTFAAYLGAAMREPVHGVSGAAIALVSIYLPSFLLIGTIVPFWNAILRDSRTLAALAGVNAAVVGLLFAAFINPVWKNAIHDPADIAIAAAAFALLFVWRVAPWIVVALCALAAQLV